MKRPKVTGKKLLITIVLAVVLLALMGLLFGIGQTGLGSIVFIIGLVGIGIYYYTGNNKKKKNGGRKHGGASAPRVHHAPINADNYSLEELTDRAYKALSNVESGMKQLSRQDGIDVMMNLKYDLFERYGTYLDDKHFLAIIAEMYECPDLRERKHILCSYRVKIPVTASAMMPYIVKTYKKLRDEILVGSSREIFDGVIDEIKADYNDRDVANDVESQKRIFEESGDDFRFNYDFFIIFYILKALNDEISPDDVASFNKAFDHAKARNYGFEEVCSRK